MLSSQRYSQLHPFFLLIQIVERLRSVLLQRPQRFDPLSCGSRSLLVYKGIIVVIILTKKSHVLRLFFFFLKTTERQSCELFFFSPFLNYMHLNQNGPSFLRKHVESHMSLSVLFLSCSISSLRRSGPDSEITS